jgi:hypothetical protein
LNTPTEDLVEQIAPRFRFDIPILDRQNAEVDQREGAITVYDQFERGRSFSIVGTIIELTVPFSGDPDFFSIKPSRFTMAPPRAALNNRQIVIRQEGRDLAAERVKAEFNRTLDEIEKYLEWHRHDAEPFNNSLSKLVSDAVEARKAKLLKDQSLVAGLGFNLKARPDAPKTYVAPVTRKKLEFKAPAMPTSSAAPFKPEPVLDDANYRHILSVMENMTLVMERSPTAFAEMGEEAIRQHYLVQLNGQFEGAATGETFNYQGKTDILIREQGKNIFIAECKFWKGEKAYSETIDQILGYLSWRDTKAAIVVFNRNKDFSGVLSSIVEATGKHPHKKRGPEKESETRFRYVFGNPTDHNREIFLTVMAFNIPTDLDEH